MPLLDGSRTTIGTSANWLVLNAGKHIFNDAPEKGVPLILLMWAVPSLLLPAISGLD